MKQTKNWLALVIATMLAFGVSFAQAASAVDAATLTAYTTDFTDTMEAIATFLTGLVVIGGLAMFGVNMTSKAIKRGGGR